MAAMVRAERAHAAAMAERADDVLAAGRAAAGLAARVQEAVLALLRATDPIDCIGQRDARRCWRSMPLHLCMEAFEPGARQLPSGTVSGCSAAGRCCSATW